MGLALRVNRFDPSIAPSVLRAIKLPLERLMLVSDQGRICPETVSFTRADFGELQS